MNLTDKEEMKIVGIFTHKDNYYMMMLNKRCNRYYLKIENNTLCNVTLEEYMDINRTYFSPRIVKGNKKIQVEPLVRFKNKLITLSMASAIALSLAGCGTKDVSNNIPVTPSVAVEETVPEVLSDNKVEEEPHIEEMLEEEIATPKTDIEQTIADLHAIGVDVEQVSPDVDIYKIKGLDLTGKEYQGIDFSPLEQAKYNYQCTPGEFGNYIDKKNVTYDDVKKALADNPNLTDELKAVLYDGLTNMESNGFGIDLSTLYYNMNRLNVVTINAGELGTSIGEFDHITGNVYIDEDLSKYPEAEAKEILIHEILGHGSTRAYNPDNRIMCDVMDTYLEIDQQGIIRDAGFLGHFAQEGIADVITTIATGQRLDPASASYAVEVYELSTLCASNGITIDDYANNGIEILVDKMNENGIGDTYRTLSIFDNLTELMMQNAVVKADLTDTFVDYYDELEDHQVENLSESTEAYKDYVYTMSVDGGEKTIIKLNDSDTVAWVYPEVVTKNIEDVNTLGR